MPLTDGVQDFNTCAPTKKGWEFGDDYQASTSLPGLYVYLTNNPATANNAFEIGRVEIFNGAHSYRISGVGLNEYDYLLYWCKPFSVKVGDGEIR